MPIRRLWFPSVLRGVWGRSNQDRDRWIKKVSIWEDEISRREGRPPEWPDWVQFYRDNDREADADFIEKTGKWEWVKKTDAKS